MTELSASARQSILASVARRVCRAERQRATFSAVLFSLLSVMAFIAVSSSPAAMSSFRDGVPHLRINAVTVACVVLALLMRWRAGRLLARHQSLPRSEALLFTSLEILLLCVFLWISANAMVRPLDVLYSPVPMLLGLAVALSVLRLDPIVSIYAGGLAAILFMGTAVVILRTEVPGLPAFYNDPVTHLFKALMMLGIGLVSAEATRLMRGALFDAMQHQEQRNELARVFGQHVSPEVVDRLLQQRIGEETETRYVCLLFLDIRDFTALAQTMDPAQVVDLLNDLYTFMIDEVNDHDGIINKFLGDGFLAVFGAPLSEGRDVENAVAAAEAILTRLESEITAGRIPPLRVGMGLHAGDAITGSVGSPTRREYTIIGNTVNIASRIEGLNKHFRSTLLVSEEVWTTLGRDLGQVTVHENVEIRGSTAAVRLYQLA